MAGLAAGDPDGPMAGAGTDGERGEAAAVLSADGVVVGVNVACAWPWLAGGPLLSVTASATTVTTAASPAVAATSRDDLLRHHPADAPRGPGDTSSLVGAGPVPAAGPADRLSRSALA